jgi:hypothetical protein
MVCGCTAKVSRTMKAERYIVHGDLLNKNEATYLFKQLKGRVKDQEIVVYVEESNYKENKETEKHLFIVVDPQLKDDYCIVHEGQKIEIKTSSFSTSQWLVYQLIEAIAQEDNRFETSDLNPAIVTFSTQCKTFDFQYREPYYRFNLLSNQSVLNGNNNVELDWGIWGHNLFKVLKEVKDSSIYAKVKGNITKEQYCFSSPVLQQVLQEYIIDNIGDGEREFSRFVISPQDNDIVCECADCVKLNKGTEDATESVTYLINRLAKRFPKHHFFTLLYRTTSKVPKAIIGKNVGVLISTIDIPKGIDLQEIKNTNKQVEQFVSQVNQWQSKTEHIYSWDYSVNFDDYLSPIPSLYALQKQLSFYQSIGIKGVFLNASGYDYATFDDVQCYVAGALMKDITLSVDQLVKQYLDKKYPTSSDLLRTYYLGLEKRYSQNKRAYSLYGSMKQSLDTYLDEKEFVVFYEKLQERLEKTRDREYTMLKQLFVGLTFTRMQIAYQKGNAIYGAVYSKGLETSLVPDVMQWLETLKQSEKLGITNYKEEGGLLNEYIEQWQKIITKQPYKNLLLNTPIYFISKIDEGFESSRLLNDGLIGLPIDYHLGWYISSVDDLQVSFATNHLQEEQEVVINFLVDSKHRFQMPEKITFWIDNKLIHSVLKKDFKIQGKVAQCKVLVDFTSSQSMQIKCTKAKGERIAIACDEIQITNQIRR